MMKYIKICAVMTLAMIVTACSDNKTHHVQDKKSKQPASTPITTTAPVNQQICHPTTDDEIASLFDRWNNSLKTGKAENVVANYALDSILLPTVSDKVRYSPAEKHDYFVHFLENAPVGQINERYIQIGCNTALDAGIYTFTYLKTGESVTGRYSYTYKWDGKQWLITSHHSSLLPEKLLAKLHQPTPTMASDSVAINH